MGRIMPLSISSSRSRAPAGRWRATWLFAILLGAGLVCGWELFLRTAGYQALLPDNELLWAYNRGKVRNGDVILVGASRIQSALNPSLLEQGLKRPVYMLAIPGTSAIPVVEEILASGFSNGLVIFDYIPRLLFDPDGQRAERVAPYLSALRKLKSPARQVEAELVLATHENLVFRRQALAPQQVTRAQLKGSGLILPHYEMGRDRFRKMDFSRLDQVEEAERLFRRIAAASPRPDSDSLRILNDRFTRIQERAEQQGVRLLLVKLPTSGKIRAFESKLYPRDQYWEHFAARTNAIHFEDYPSLRSIEPPDGSHLGREQAQQFTEAFVEVVKRSFPDIPVL